MVDVSSRASYAHEPWFPQVQEFADWLKEIREQTGFTQADVAELIGSSKSRISGWENGHHVPAQKAVDAYVEYFDLGTAFVEAWKAVRARVDRFVRLQRQHALEAQKRHVPTWYTDAAPPGYTGAWWDPIIIDVPRAASYSFVDQVDDSRLYDWDFVRALRAFDADLLIVEEFDEYEPWSGVPRRLAVPGLRSENWTAPASGLPTPSNDVERRAWKDWLTEQQAEARRKFISEETLQRARQQRRNHLDKQPERKEQMAAPKGFIKENSNTKRAYGLVQDAGTSGMTAHEIAVKLDIPDVKAAAAMSELHQKEYVARLIESRLPAGRMRAGRVYVTVENIDGRVTLPYGRKAASAALKRPDERKVRLKVSKGARRSLPEGLRSEVEAYQYEIEVAGTRLEAPTDPPVFPIPWTVEQRAILKAYWEGLVDGDIALATYMVSVQDRFK